MPVAAGGVSYKRPSCPTHNAPATSFEHPQLGKVWVCGFCQREKRIEKEYAKVQGKSLEGLELPPGVRDERLLREVEEMTVIRNRKMRRARR